MPAPGGGVIFSLPLPDKTMSVKNRPAYRLPYCRSQGAGQQFDNIEIAARIDNSIPYTYREIGAKIASGGCKKQRDRHHPTN